MKKNKNLFNQPNPIMEKAINNRKNRGYHLLVVKNKLFRSKTGEGAAKILKKVREKYPEEIPALTYIPKADTLILWK